MRSKNRLAFLLSCAIVVATVPLLSLPVRAQSRPYTYKGGFIPISPTSSNGTTPSQSSVASAANNRRST